MKRLYSLTVRTITLLIAVIAFNQGVVMSMQQYAGQDTTKFKQVKISDSRIYKPALYNSAVKSNYIPFKPNTISGSVTLKGLQQDPVNILNVKIYPIPVSDQINMSYHLNKDSNVIIEIFDFLGSKISTLLSQRKHAGEQKESFPISSKLASGRIYFIRVTVGNQQVSKRISVL